MSESKSLSELQKSPAKSRSMKELQALPPKQRVKAFLEDNKKAIQAALPKHINKDRMLQVAQTAVTQNPQLLECDTGTLFGALIRCTQLGLEPNNALGQLYLIPFNNRKKQRKDVQVIIGYKGMIDLARRSGHIESLQAIAVRDGDEFSFEYGLNEHLKHIPGANRGEITHFYAYAKLKGGGFQFEVLPLNDVIAIMKSTQSRGEYGPWKDHFEQMGRKSLIRRLFNYLPVSIEMSEAQALDATGETKAQELDNIILEDVEYSVIAPDTDDMAPPAGSDEAPAQRTAAEPIADVNGEIFDPKIHLETASGKPMYNADDSFRKRPNRGKEDGAEPVTAAAPDQQQPPPLEDQAGMSHATGSPDEQTNPPSDDNAPPPPDDDEISME